AVHGARHSVASPCYLLAGDGYHAVPALSQHRPALCGDLQRPAGDVARPRVRDQHRFDPPAWRRDLAAPDRLALRPRRPQVAGFRRRGAAGRRRSGLARRTSRAGARPGEGWVTADYRLELDAARAISVEAAGLVARYPIG